MLLPSAMIIDDSGTDRYLLKRLLRRGKIAAHVFEAQDGVEAIELLTNGDRLREEHPDKFPPLLLFLDINMPRMNGFAFLDEFAKLRESHELTDVALMVMSSTDRQEEKERALEYDFVKGFITKMPIDAESLKAEVQRSLSP